MEQFGRYELRRRLGVGGMAEVYEAVALVAEGVEKPLVIKRILEEHSRDPRFRSMFVDEARVALRLNHPNVVQVFDFGKVDDRYFLAMELVRGKDLGAMLARAKQQDRTLPAAAALFIAGEVAKGLDHAHRMTGADGKPFGLVHRDVSPQNILVSTEGAVKIGDFGIAKFESREGMTQATSVRGKVRYLSPEQAENLALDARSDLFSLGLVLYEMVTGHYAFDGKSDFEVLQAARRAKPVPASKLAQVPPELERILEKALARDPRERYARGNELQRDLEKLAMEEGLRAGSNAIGEILSALFPELQRVSDEHGETVIRRLPDVESVQEPIADRTRIRRMPDEPDGLKVFMSEEIPLSEASPSLDEATDTGRAEITEAGRATATQTRVRASDPPTSTVPAVAAQRARSRAEPTLARMPMPPVEEAVEESTDVRRAEPSPSLERRSRASRAPLPFDDDGQETDLAAAIVTPAAPEKRVAPVGAVQAAAPVERRPPPPPVARGAQAGPIVLVVVVLSLALVFLLLRGTHFGRSLLGAEEPISMPQLSGGPSGYLSLEGKDGDTVAVDGVTVGTLPLPAIALSAGLHSVSVNGEKDRIDFAVNISVGETERKDLDASAAPSVP